MDPKHILFKPPFTMMVAGPTGCGKTVLVRRLLKNFKLLMPIDKPVLKVIWCYGQYQEGYKIKIPNVEITYIDGLIQETDLKKNKPDFVVVDDLMTELAGDKRLSNLFTKGSHHLGINVIFIVQNIFHQGKEMRTISLNCHYIAAMKNPRDRAQILTFARQYDPSNTRFFLEAFDDATSTPYGYLLIDLKPDTPDNIRLRSRVTPEETLKGVVAPIVYMKK